MQFCLEAGMRQWVPLKNKQAVGDHHRHFYMEAFRCVSNTKQHALCSLVLFPQRHALATPWTSCGKLKPDSWTAVLMTVWFCKLLFLIFLYLQFSFCSFLRFLLFFSKWLFLLALSSFLFIIIFAYPLWIKLNGSAISLPVQQISYLLLDTECKTKPYATNCCKLPWIQIISTKKPVRVWSVINSPAVLFCNEIAKHSVRVGLLSWSQTL